MVPRREYLRRTGGVAAVGILGSLAGCTGGGGAGTSSFKMTAIPASPSAIIIGYLDEEGILSEKVQEAGYDSVEVQLTFEGPPQFASGRSDLAVGDMSGLEAARLGPEREIELAVLGRITSNYIGMLVATDGEYDPEMTGGVQQTIDKVVEDEATVGIPGWESGAVPPSQIILQEVYGYSLAEDGGDFPAVSADYGAIPRLLLDGEMAMGLSAPPLGATPMFLEDPPSVTQLYWNSDALIDAGFGVPPIGDVVARQTFADENEAAIDAVLSAYDEGVNWFLENPVDIVSQTENLEIVGANNEAEAEFIVSWAFEEFENEYAPQWSPYYENPRATDDWIEQNQEFLSNTADVGQIPANWNDYVEFRSV